MDYDAGQAPASRFERKPRGRARAGEGLFSRRAEPAVQADLFGCGSAPPKPPDAAEDAPAFEEPRVVHDVPDEAGDLLAVGTRVLHPKFGEGEIRVLEGRPDNLRATIHFRRTGPKRIYLRFAELEILGR